MLFSLFFNKIDEKTTIENGISDWQSSYLLPKTSIIDDKRNMLDVYISNGSSNKNIYQTLIESHILLNEHG